MIILISLYTALVFGIGNALRGSSIISRLHCCLMLSLVVSSQFLPWNGEPDWASFFLYTGILFPTLLLGLSLGWGKGFSSFTGRLNPIETEVSLIDAIAYRIVKNPTTSGDNRKWGVVWMTLRGLLFYPVFISIGAIKNLNCSVFGECAYTYDYSAFLVGLVSLSMGLVYGSMRLLPEKYGVRTAEFLYAFILGFAINYLIFS